MTSYLIVPANPTGLNPAPSYETKRSRVRSQRRGHPNLSMDRKIRYQRYAASNDVPNVRLDIERTWIRHHSLGNFRSRFRRDGPPPYHHGGKPIARWANR